MKRREKIYWSIVILSFSFITLLILFNPVSAQLNNTWTAYNYPNITGIASIFTYDNNTTNGWFGNGLIFVLWIILLLVFSFRTEITGSLAASSLIATVLSIIIRSNSLVSDSTIMIFISMTVIGITLMFKGGNIY
jgi:hypothetical protein